MMPHRQRFGCPHPHYNHFASTEEDRLTAAVAVVAAEMVAAVAEMVAAVAEMAAAAVSVVAESVSVAQHH